MAIGLGEGAFQSPNGIMAGLAQVLDSSNPELYKAMQLSQQKKAAEAEAKANKEAEYEKMKLKAGEGKYLTPLNNAVYGSVFGYNDNVTKAIRDAQDAGATISREEQDRLNKQKEGIQLGMANAARYTETVDTRREAFEKDPTIDEGYFMKSAIQIAKDKGLEVQESDLDAIANDPRLYRPDKVAENVAESIQAADFEEIDISKDGIISKETKDVKGYQTYIDEDGNRRLATRDKRDADGNIVGKEYIKEWSKDDMTNAMGRADVKALVNERVNILRETTGRPPVSKDNPMTDDELSTAFNGLMSGQSNADMSQQYQNNQMALENSRAWHRKQLQEQKMGQGDKEKKKKAKSLKEFVWHVQRGDKKYVDMFSLSKDVRSAEYDDLNEQIVLTMEPKSPDESPFTRVIDLRGENGGFADIAKYSPYSEIDPDVLKEIPPHREGESPVSDTESQYRSKLRQKQILTYAGGVGLDDFIGIELEGEKGGLSPVAEAEYDKTTDYRDEETNAVLSRVRLTLQNGQEVHIYSNDYGRFDEILRKNAMYGRGAGFPGYESVPKSGLVSPKTADSEESGGGYGDIGETETEE